jgi:hypothetical protein
MGDELWGPSTCLREVLQLWTTKRLQYPLTPPSNTHSIDLSFFSMLEDLSANIIMSCLLTIILFPTNLRIFKLPYLLCLQFQLRWSVQFLEGQREFAWSSLTSSTVPFIICRTTLTFLVWPIRLTRAIA